VIQAILRHANVSTTANYYIKTAASDVSEAMARFENEVAEAAAKGVLTQTQPAGRQSIQ